MIALFQCAECRRAAEFHEMYTISGKRICADCADRLTFVCEDCGRRFWKSHFARDGPETLCANCYCKRAETTDI